MARKKIKEEVPEPNLVPVMNLVMLLIPFLLMASAFFEVAIIKSLHLCGAEEKKGIAPAGNMERRLQSKVDGLRTNDW